MEPLPRHSPGVDAGHRLRGTFLTERLPRSERGPAGAGSRDPDFERALLLDTQEALYQYAGEMQDFALSLRGESDRSYGSVVGDRLAGRARSSRCSRPGSRATRLREVLGEVLAAGQAVIVGHVARLDEWSDATGCCSTSSSTAARVRASVPRSSRRPAPHDLTYRVTRERRHDIGTRGTMWSPTRSKISSRLWPVIVSPWFRSPTTARDGSGAARTRSATEDASCTVPHG